MASYRLVEHTHEVLSQVDAVRYLAREAESTQRAFMLTKSEACFSDYHLHRHDAPRALETLARLVKDNPLQSLKMEPLRQVLAEHLNLLDENVNNADTIGSTTLAVQLEKSAGKSLELDHQISGVKTAELQLLDTRRDRFLDERRQFQRIAGISCVVGLLAVVAGAGIVFRECRNRMRYEARLAEARDAALDSVKTTSVFLASVGHEIRTPMNGVLGAADLLLRDTSLSARQRDGVETIRTSGKTLLAIINDILDLSKLQAGEMSFVTESFSPSAIVEDVLTHYADRATKKGLELTSHLEPDLPAQVMGDRQHFRQVLQNLVSNAVKFTNAGSVSIHVMRRRQMESENRICLRIDVRDTGPGITPEAQQRLFVPFAQASSKGGWRQGGTGLGLAVSQELVQRMNGTLNVESTPGQGAKFWFTVVFEAVAEPAAAQKLVPGALLIVENRALTAESVRTHASSWGLHPVIATSTKDLPDSFGVDSDGQPLPLCAVVVGSPQGESWQETVRVLRQKSGWTRCPVYLMSDGEGLDDEFVEKIGVAGLLTYPFRPSELYGFLSGTPVPPAAKLADRLELSSARILVADDNPVNQRVLKNQLEYLGMQVTPCSDGAEALKLAREGGHEVILLDCQMPVMDGFEATRKIREWESLTGAKRVPIIAVTAHVMAGDAELCLEAGMDGYLPKPVEVDRLQQALLAWLAPGTPTTAAPEAGAGNNTLPHSQPPVVDETQLKHCLTGDRSLDRELVRMAAEQMTEVLDQLDAALREDANTSWQQAAHLGRGSGATMGFTELSALFQRAEFDTIQKADRADILAELHEAVARLENRLHELGYPSAAQAS
ncbi:ATP-binding protein [Verrucomicrobium spinosum]|uniref:ATP-binding protein n=1 Tax=Verrucomicrobium spinosum TaxID=2736 RepID=UPI0001744D5A|nr:ATP-binding protein [Verrucomicrobium spinosum]